MGKNNVNKRRVAKINKKKKNNKKLDVIIDIGTSLHYLCAVNGLIDVNYDFKKLFLELSKNVDKNNKETVLIEVINNLEELIRETVEEFSVYEMIYFSRRIFPENIFKCEKNEIFLYRNIMSLAFTKYCKCEVEYYINKKYVLPSGLKNIDMNVLLQKIKLELLPEEMKNILIYAAKMFNICYIVEFYCYYYIYLVKQYRTLCKGAELEYFDEYGVGCISNEELVKKTELYDYRQRYFNILSNIGGHVDIKINKEDIKGLDDFIILQFQENLEKIVVDEIMCLNESKKNIRKNQVTNYFPIPINLKKYYNYANYFSEEFYNFYNFSVEDFFVFMIILCKNNILEMCLSMEKKYHMFQRGYTFYKYDELRRGFEENYERFSNSLGFSRSQDIKSVFEKIFEFLSISNEDRKQISLKAINHYKIFTKINQSIGIIDYTNWGRILEDIMIPICKENDKKGDVFEDIVIEKVKEEFGDKSLWIVKRELKANGQKREIDVSFVIDDLLFILECKSINYSIASYIGDKKAVDFRQMKSEKAIKQADKTFKFIIDNQKDLNIKLPDNIKGIVSLIVTSVPEYIWELNDSLMINENLPRILSIEELSELKKINVIKDIYNARFYRKIN